MIKQPTLDYFYQTVGFHFEVYFFWPEQPRDGMDARFQSVSGLDVQIETETIKEGGENRFEHRVPGRAKYSDIVLKRGLLSPKSNSAITKWFNDAVSMYQFYDNGKLLKPIKPVNLDIILLNEEHHALMKWEVYHAWPKNWKIGELNAERSEVLIETLELNHNGFQFVGV